MELAGDDDGGMWMWIAVCCLVGLWWMRRSVLFRREISRPPGPWGLPILGNLLQLGKLPHQALARLSSIHGPLMSLRLGAVPLLVASSPHAAKLILHTHDKLFSGRPIHLSAPSCIMGPGSPDILFRQPGPYWKLVRRICVSDFFNYNQLDHFCDVRMREVRGLLLSILAVQGSPISIRDMLHSATNNTICTMVLGKPLHQFISADLNINSVLLDVKSSLDMFKLGDYIPRLAWLDYLQGYHKRDREAARNAQSVLQKVIDTRRRQRSQATSHSDAPGDFLDLLLFTSTDAKNKHLLLDDANIRAVLLDMFLAGTDTSVVPIEWALAELFANPEKMRKLQQEVGELVGASRIVEESDVQNLPYLRAVVNEALRLHPPAPLLVPHRSLEACKIEGYEIPASTVVYVNVWAIQRDPSLWENPLEFCPERFLESPLLDALPGSHFEFLPFGSGRRSCPAWKLGLVSVQTILANIIHAFEWTLPAGKPSLTEKFGVAVALEEPLVAVPSPRLHPDAFLPADHAAASAP